MSKLNLLDRQLAAYTRKIQNRASYLSFVATTLVAIRETFNHIELRYLKNFFMELIQKFPKDTELLSIYNKTHPNFVFIQIYPLIDSHLKEKLINSYISLFNLRNDQGKSPLSEEQAIGLLSVIKEHPGYFNSKNDQIKNAVQEMFYEYQYLKIFREDSSQKLFVSDQTINNYINTITTEDLNQNLFKEKLELLFILSIEDKIETILNKIFELIQFESGQPFRDQRIILTGLIKSFVTKFKNQIDQLPNANQIQEISDSMTDWYSKDEDWQHRFVYVQLIQELIELQNNPSKNGLENQVKDFVNNAPFEDIKNLEQKEIENLASNYPEEFINATLRDLRILNLGIKGLANNHMPKLVDNLLEKSKSFSMPDEKKAYFDIVANLKCAGDTNLVTKFHSELMSIKNSNSDFVKKYIYADKRRLFTLTQKKELKSA